MSEFKWFMWLFDGIENSGTKKPVCEHGPYFNFEELSLNAQTAQKFL